MNSKSVLGHSEILAPTETRTQTLVNGTNYKKIRQLATEQWSR